MTCTQAVEPFLFRQGTEGRAQATQKGRAQATYRGVELAPLLVALVGDGRNERRGGQGVHAEAHRSVEERLYAVHGNYYNRVPTFLGGHACFARANGLGHPCFAHRVVNQHAQNGDHYNPADTAETEGHKRRTISADMTDLVDGVHRLGRGRGSGGRQQQQRRLTFVLCAY